MKIELKEEVSFAIIIGLIYDVGVRLWDRVRAQCQGMSPVEWNAPSADSSANGFPLNPYSSYEQRHGT